MLPRDSSRRIRSKRGKMMDLLMMKMRLWRTMARIKKKYLRDNKDRSSLRI